VNFFEHTSWLTFGRLRPLHTNAVIFALVGNMMFAGIYYSTQRLGEGAARLAISCRTPLLGLAG
jgi:cbb3-type cytochrome oxidase subunit 1